MQWALTGNALPWDLVMQDSQLETASYLTDVAYEKNPTPWLQNFGIF